jgi:hypothetical protein
MSAVELFAEAGPVGWLGIGAVCGASGIEIARVLRDSKGGSDDLAYGLG